MTTWVVVADSSRCRIYTQDGHNKPLAELEDLVHPDARLRGRDLADDRPGDDHGSFGVSRHPMGARTDPKHHEAEVFAREIAHYLERGHAEGRFRYLALVAPPAFLGMLRAAIGADLKRLVISEVGKDLVSHGANEVSDHLNQPHA
jgi:protein required for attachment to host cells